MIKVISIRQPYAKLITDRLKHNETRDWATPYRGEILIHAASAWGRGERDDLSNLIDFPEIAELFRPVLADGERPPLGVGVCVATLVDCIPVERIRDRLSKLERAVGNYSDGRFAWILKDVRPIETFAFKGRLGVFDFVLPAPLVLREHKVAQLPEAAPLTLPQAKKPASADFSARRKPINASQPPVTVWTGIHPRNPYTPLLVGQRPDPNVIDPNWCRLVDHVYSWTAATLEIEFARQRLAEDHAAWVNAGKDAKHHLDMLRAREQVEIARNGEASAPLAAQIKRAEAEYKALRKKKWNLNAEAQIAAAQDRLIAVEDNLATIVVANWLVKCGGRHDTRALGDSDA